MKAFWAVVGLLMVGAAVYLVTQRPFRSDPADTNMVPISGAVPQKFEQIPMGPWQDRSVPPASAIKDKPGPAPLPAATPVVEEAKPQQVTVAPSIDTTPASGSKPAADVKAPSPTGPAKPVESSPSAPQAKPTEAGPSETKPSDAKPAEGAKAADPLAAKIVTKDDGSMLVDDKFVVRGKGTAEEPYKVTWDQLLSAQDDYVPKDGRKKIPGRISMLDGKWVEVTGYIAFPVMAETQDEALSMMNQWDGCCIGVPPTPYDAIEVRLKTPATGNARMTTYGSMKGKFKVDAHLVGGWLVGLYVMDSASMGSQSYGGFAP